MDEEARMLGMVVSHADSINDVILRATVHSCLEQAPAEWWKAPSSTRYHPPDERGPNGRLIHCLRMCSMADQAARWLSQGTPVVESFWRDHWMAAAIIHDLWYCEDKANHAAIAASHIPENFPMVRSAIKLHMGPWGEGWDQEMSPLARLFHSADFWLTRTNVLTDWEQAAT